MTWHLQGHLQKNKVKKAVAMADLIQSADSLSILREIDKRAAEIDKVQDVLLGLIFPEKKARQVFPQMT